jgi:hypothetical protein
MYVHVRVALRRAILMRFSMRCAFHP